MNGVVNVRLPIHRDGLVSCIVIVVVTVGAEHALQVHGLRFLCMSCWSRLYEAQLESRGGSGRIRSQRTRLDRRRDFPLFLPPEDVHFPLCRLRRFGEALEMTHHHESNSVVDRPAADKHGRVILGFVWVLKRAHVLGIHGRRFFLLLFLLC